MSRSSLQRRTDRLAILLCPRCGQRLRHQAAAASERPQVRDDHRRILEDASTEDLQQIEEAFQRIQRRHEEACRQRGEQPSSFDATVCDQRTTTT